MSDDFWRHLIGCVSAGILGLGAAVLVLALVGAWFARLAEGDEDAIFVTAVVAVLILTAGAFWGLS